MAYFDSAKNRAMWQKELDLLRAERKRREAGGFGLTDGADEKDGLRVRITYQELEAEEYAAVRAQRHGKQKAWERRKEMSVKAAAAEGRQKEQKQLEREL